MASIQVGINLRERIFQRFSRIERKGLKRKMILSWNSCINVKERKWENALRIGFRLGTEEREELASLGRIRREYQMTLSSPSSPLYPKDVSMYPRWGMNCPGLERGDEKIYSGILPAGTESLSSGSYWGCSFLTLLNINIYIVTSIRLNRGGIPRNNHEGFGYKNFKICLETNYYIWEYRVYIYVYTHIYIYILFTIKLFTNKE